jgi:2-phosphoxylose phosphatase
VYLDLLGIVPHYPSPEAVFRVTNNPITSQVASMIISGMYADLNHRQIPLQIQPDSIDSLEPRYPCPSALSLYDKYASGSSNPAWTNHLHASRILMAELDSISGVDPSNAGFHASFDHYFDNLSSRQCHGRVLPCSVSDGSKCITETMANSVYRLGQYEYSYIYRAAPESLSAAVGSFGIWFAELAQNIRDAISGVEGPQYRHNIAHDGSIALVLAILQIDLMVWPGMGSEIVFEVYRVENKDGRFVVRVLWGGKPLRSSNPSLGVLDMVDLNVLLGYFDGLVGPGARNVVKMCTS